jgi:hypothetical protein
MSKTSHAYLLGNPTLEEIADVLHSSGRVRDTRVHDLDRPEDTVVPGMGIIHFQEENTGLDRDLACRRGNHWRDGRREPLAVKALEHTVFCSMGAGSQAPAIMRALLEHFGGLYQEDSSRNHYEFLEPVTQEPVPHRGP